MKWTTWRQRFKKVVWTAEGDWIEFTESPIPNYRKQIRNLITPVIFLDHNNYSNHCHHHHFDKTIITILVSGLLLCWLHVPLNNNSTKVEMILIFKIFKKIYDIYKYHKIEDLKKWTTLKIKSNKKKLLGQMSQNFQRSSSRSTLNSHWFLGLRKWGRNDLTLYILYILHWCFS